MQIAAVFFDFMRFDDQILVYRNWADVFDCELGGDGANAAEAIDFAHGLVENEGDDAAVDESATALIFGSEFECAADSARGVVLLVRQLHAARVCAAAAEAGVGRVGCE